MKYQTKIYILFLILLAMDNNRYVVKEFSIRHFIFKSVVNRSAKKEQDDTSVAKRGKEREIERE